MGADLLPAASAQGHADLAASIPVPVDAFGPARAYCVADHQPGDRLSNGLPAGRGGRTTYRVCFALEGGRRRELVGPTFERPREAARLAELLNGHGVVASDMAATSATGSAEPARPRLCIACQGPLPAGSRPHRRTCSAACRQRLVRGARAAERSARGSQARGAGSVTPAAVSGGPAQLALDLPTQHEAAASVRLTAAARSEMRHGLATPTAAV